MSIDLAALTAIDTHVHIEADAHGCFALDDELMAASAKYFSADAHRAPTLDRVAEYYRSRNMAAVVFTVDAHTATGHKALSSREIVERDFPETRQHRAEAVAIKRLADR